jgi:hypothetical protein
MALPAIGSNAVFQEAGYFQILAIFSSSRTQAITLSGKYINTMSGKSQE